MKTGYELFIEMSSQISDKKYTREEVEKLITPEVANKPMSKIECKFKMIVWKTLIKMCSKME